MVAFLLGEKMKARIHFFSLALSLSLLFLLALSGAAQAANDSNAGSMQKFCEPFRANSAPSIDKAFCRGYMVGFRAGLEGAQVPDDKGILQIVTFTDGVTEAQMAREFLLYMDNHPEEKEALPKIALMHSMVSGGLVRLAPVDGDKKK